MSKKISLSFAISISALASAVTFILTFSFTRGVFNDKISEIDRLSEKYQRLEELDAIVQKEYYTEPPTDDIIEGMLAGYVSGLGDKYSIYRSEKEYEAYEDSNAGVYTGIGITVQQQQDGTIKVISVSDNGPAKKSGIVPGDFLVAVENVNAEENYQEAISAINGDAGTAVSIRIRHADNSEEDYSLTREQMDEITVTEEMLDNHIGYIQITKFRDVSVSQFQNALHDLLQKGAKGFIFDVRDNGGGVLSALEQMVDPILPEGDLAFAYDRENNATPILTSDAESMEMPYAVLVNGNSASAAELFACLMRDYADAVLVGEKTFGKGIMQTTFSLSGGGVTLTTATYATGKTPCYHGIGLEPDVLSVPEENAEEDTQKDDAIRVISEKLQEPSGE